jgi:DNA helicase HerA-like ATPase
MAMTTEPPEGWSCLRLGSFPRAELVGERFAILAATFADLHASSQSLWMSGIGVPESGEVVMAVASQPGSAHHAWGEMDPQAVAAESLAQLLTAHPERMVLVPRGRSDPDSPAPDLGAAGLLGQLRLMEQVRSPVQTAVTLTATPVPGDVAGEAIDQLLASTSPAIANQTGRTNARAWVEHHRARALAAELTGGLGAGLWEARVEIRSDRNGLLGRSRGALNASLRLLGPYELVPSGPTELGGARDPGAQGPLVTAGFLSSLGLPPFGEVSGFRSRQIWYFDQTPERRDPAEPGAKVGDVLTPTGSPSGPFLLDRRNLVRHTLVTGATGSGKTETVKRIVHTVDSDFGMPWLIIEPAKSEYRHLRTAGDGADGPVVLRPGDPLRVPLRFNPLEPEPGFPLRTHLDLVHALFVAAFEPIDPLPQILASAIDRVYRDAGWVVPLDRMRDVRRDPRPSDYPTLSDLQRSAGSVIESVGYQGETLSNVRGFVDVRLASLRLGTAGTMLERGYPVDFGKLMGQQVVVELDDIGNDQEKSFLMGVLLVRLYEYLRCRMAELARRGEFVRDLAHVTIVEEAHRLLKAAKPGERPNFAVESFANMLAELRAYGEGLVIVEQIPSKIIADAIKNTGTKILHRLPAYDDRELAGRAANVEPDQLLALGSLPPGHAVCFTDEMDRPAIVAVQAIDRAPRSETALSDRIVPAGVPARQDLVCVGTRDSPCVLGDLLEGDLEVSDATAAALWLELALVFVLRRWVVRQPSETVRASFASMGDCGRCSLLQGTIGPRRAEFSRISEDVDAAAAFADVVSKLLLSNTAGEEDDALRNAAARLFLSSPDQRPPGWSTLWPESVEGQGGNSRIIELIGTLRSSGFDSIEDVARLIAAPHSQEGLRKFLAANASAAFP